MEGFYLQDKPSTWNIKTTTLQLSRHSSFGRNILVSMIMAGSIFQADCELAVVYSVYLTSLQVLRLN